MNYIFYLQKLKTLFDSEVKYYLETKDGFIFLNDLIGKNISINYLNEIQCFCGKLVEKTFKENFCYKCFYELPQTGESIFFPEKSKAHLNIEDRNLEWEKQNQLQPHIVYIAISGGIKIGVTKKSNMITRWIDQGADFAMPFAQMPNRFLAGKLENEMKKYISDKTNWKNMLKNSYTVSSDYILITKKNLILKVPFDLKEYILIDENIQKIIYPHKTILEKINSTSLEKENNITGFLTGIKGQYLIFDNNKVINIRKHEGYKISLSF